MTARTNTHRCRPGRARTTAARCAPPTPGAKSRSGDGSPRAATTADSSSSICATARAWCSWSSIPRRRPQRTRSLGAPARSTTWRRAARWCCAPRAPSTPSFRPAKIEIAVTEAHILNVSQPPPFPIDGDATAEDVRLRYRYIDLRRPAMQRNLRRRALAVQATRSFLDSSGFVEIETPILWRATPEGARDYLVPSRVNPGTFLRAAAIAAALEAAPDGERLRSLLSDRAMLSRRGPAREPPARVQPDRYRDDLSARRRRGGDRRGHDGGDLPPRARGRAEAAVFAPAVRRSDGTFRRRQAGHALRDGAEEPQRRVCRHAVQGVRRSARARREYLRNRAARGVSVEPPRARRDDRGRAHALRARPGLRQDRERRMARADRAPSGRRRADARRRSGRASRRATRC